MARTTCRKALSLLLCSLLALACPTRSEAQTTNVVYTHDISGIAVDSIPTTLTVTLGGPSKPITGVRFDFVADHGHWSVPIDTHVQVTAPNGESATVHVGTSGITWTTNEFSANLTLPLSAAMSQGTWTFTFLDTLEDIPGTEYTFKAGSSISLIGAASMTMTLVSSTVELTANVSASISAPTVTNAQGSTSFAISPPLPTGLSLSPTGQITGTPTAAAPSTSYTLTVTDGVARTASQTLQLAVAPELPTFNYTLAAYLLVGLPAPGIGVVTSSIPDATYAISPALPTGLSLNPASGAVTGAPTAASPPMIYTVTATNSAYGMTRTYSQAFAMQISAPILGMTASRTTLTGTVGTAIDPLVLQPTGGDGSYNFTFTPDLPEGLDFDTATRTISGTPTVPVAPSSITASVSDGAGFTHDLALTLRIDWAPVTVTLSATTATLTQGTPMTAIHAVAAGGDGSYSYSVTPALPSGLALDAATGILSGTPGVLQTVTPYTIRATDAQGSHASVPLILSVDHEPLSAALSASAVVLERGKQMAPVTLTASGGDGAYSYAIAPALPQGLTFDTTTGVLSGTPTVILPATAFTLTAADGAGHRRDLALSLTVAHATLALSLPPAPVQLLAGTAMTPVTLTASGGDGRYSYTIAPALPQGLSLDPQSGTISGTPTAASALHSYTATATDGLGTRVSGTLTLSVGQEALAIRLPRSDLALTAGSAMAAFLPQVTGGDGHYSFSVTPALPAGLRLDPATGAISGTPTVGTAAAVPHEITVRDGAEQTRSATLTLSITARTPGLSLSATDVALIRGRVMSPVLARVTGGSGGSVFAVEPSLPDGLSIDRSSGTISGTPRTVRPAASYRVTTTDSAGGSSFATLSIAVHEDEEAVVEEVTQSVQSFMAARADRILASEPRGLRFETRLRRDASRNLVARADDDQARLIFSHQKTHADGSWYTWIEGKYTSYRDTSGRNGNRKGDFGMVSLGADYLVTENLAVGIMAQLDRMSEVNRGRTDLSGTGWSVGPYMAGRIREGLFYTARIGWGETANRTAVNVHGGEADWFAGDFDTDRVIATASLYGLNKLEGGLTIVPEIDISWLRERQKVFRVSDGISAVTVPESEIDLTRFTLSAAFEQEMAPDALTAYIRPALSWDIASTGNLDRRDAYGALEIGARSGMRSTWHGDVSVAYDGIGDPDLSAWTVRLHLSREF